MSPDNTGDIFQQMNDIIISLPIYLEFGVKKKSTFSLNLNTYRNAHHHILNKAKVLFDELVSPTIQGLPKMAKVELTYRLFFGSKRRIDVANVCCIVDKFFSDTLVNTKKLPGDDREIISSVHYSWGGIDTTNPHVEVTLSNIELFEETPDQDPNMQISFTHAEIREALVEYLEKQITLAPGQTVSLEFDLDDPSDIIAYVDVLREGQKAQGVPSKPESEKTVSNKTVEGRAPEAPVQRKTRGPNKPKPIVEAAQETEKLNEPIETEQGEDGIPDAIEEEVTSEPSAKTEDAPFADPATVAAEVEKITTEKAAALAAPTGNSIFPNAGSSAAAAPQPVAASNPKSLFAGLIRPTNAPTAH